MLSIDTEKCIRCGSCARGCPMGVVRMVDGAPAVGHEERCIQCWHCMAACPVQAVHAEGLAPEYPATPESGLERLLKLRRSVRHFRRETPDRALIRHALDSAAWAPSGKNEHYNRWTVLWGVEAAARVRECTMELCRKTGYQPGLLKLLERGNDLLTCGAPCIIIGHNHAEKATNPMLDTAIAMVHAELVLVEAGLGTCWGGFLRRAINDLPELKAQLGITPEREAYAVLMTGKPDGEAYRNAPNRPAAGIDWIE